MTRPRNLFWAAVAVVAMPGFGQAAAPTAFAPDFSGFWVHPFFPGIEPPPSGPGPVFNRNRRATGVGESRAFVGDYTNPILKPNAAAVVKKFGEISSSDNTYGTPSNRCWPSGVPYIFFQPGMEMLQQPREIIFMYLRNHEFRNVRLNDSHPAHVIPSWYGDSVAHYEADTLVIDTVGVKTERPFAMLDMYGTPYSAALHVVERYRMVDQDEAQAALKRNLTQHTRVPDTRADLSYTGKQLQVIFTVDDEGVFTTPWSGAITYEHPGQAWEENVCAENPFEFFAGRTNAYVPTATKPDF
jgi:hypothetical protein